MRISDWSSDVCSSDLWWSSASSNTTVDGININTGCPAGNVDNAIRSVMALIRGSFASTLKTFFNGSAPLPIANGGTGSATKEDARTALGLGVLATATTVDIDKGGSGKTTADRALNARGGVGGVDTDRRGVVEGERVEEGVGVGW